MIAETEEELIKRLNEWKDNVESKGITVSMNKTKVMISGERQKVKKCIEHEVQGPRPKRTWREVVREDCQARKLNKEDAVDHCKWRKMIKDVR